VPAVWGHDAALGALLLEAIPSEAPLAELNVAVELDAVAALIRGLHGSGAPALTDGVVPLEERVEFVFDHWIERRRGDVDALRRGYELARALAADATPDPVLLHGDLHAGNVLDGGPERGLVAIDPRPCVGDAAFDAVDWPFHGTDDPRTWKPRSRELAHALGLDPERLWAWCRALAPMLGVAL
jgi:streptomycin 6-kinase